MTNTPQIDRRQFLVVTGASILLASQGLGCTLPGVDFVNIPGGPAYAPWSDWRGLAGDGPLALVRAAVVAANPHNTQPWLFRVTSGSNRTQIEVLADTQRNIGSVDPMLREMHLGIGCALENLTHAAAVHGYSYAMSLNESDPALATIRLTPATPTNSVLFDAIGKRHTNRGAFDLSHPVDSDALNHLTNLADDADVKLLWFSSPDDRTRFGDIIVEATEAFIADTPQSRDSARWFRFSNREIELRRDGLTLYAQGLSPLILAAAKLFPISRQRADRSWLASTRDVHVATASAFGLIVVRDHRSNVQRMKAGMYWQRMHLWAAANGLAMHPLNQPLERSDREETIGLPPRFGNLLARLIADSSWQPIMSFRIGYPSVIPMPSPRRSLDSVLLRA